jgi:hypothetical protein
MSKIQKHNEEGNSFIEPYSDAGVEPKALPRREGLF